MPSQEAARLARRYGVRIGLTTAIFAAAQVLVSIAAYHDNVPLVQTMRLNFAAIADSSQVAPLTLFLYFLATFFSAPVVATYLSGIVAGIIMICYAFYAGRLTAQGLGRRAYGATAGYGTALVTGGIWVLLSALGVVLLRMDGTYSGMYYSSRAGFLVPQLLWVLAQTIAPALLGLGLGALAGLLGASTANLSMPAWQPPVTPQYPYWQQPAPSWLPQGQSAGVAQAPTPPSQ